MRVLMPGTQAFAPNVWVIDGPHVRDLGVQFPTRMTVVSLANGSVWVDSPVPVPFETLKRIAALGSVSYLVAATPRHVWRLEAWHTLFPEAQLWVPRASPLTLKKGHLPFTGMLGDTSNPEWADDFDQLAFKGNPPIEEVLFFHRASRTVMLDDLIQVHPSVKGKPFRDTLFKLLGVASPQGGVPTTSGCLSRSDNSLDNRWNSCSSGMRDKLIIGHGACIEHDAKLFVEQDFHWLRR